MNKEEKKSLTRKEAIEAGYVSCGRVGQDWQTLWTIADLTEQDFKEHEFLIADTTPKTPSIDSQQIKELIATQVEEEWGSETGDDTNEAYEIINAMDIRRFDPLTEIINTELSKYETFALTTITLLP